jgi:predicted aspartyl protease
MITGQFNSQGELVFEISLVAADKDQLLVNAVLDTGFTGWLALNTQDAESLGWTLNIQEQRKMNTAWGEADFDIYEGTISLDGEQFTIEMLAGNQFEDILLGVYWLQIKRLVADFSTGVLTLG